MDNGVKRTNTLYGDLHIESSRIVFAHGSTDPWHALGITKTLRKETPSIYIKGIDFSFGAAFQFFF